MSKATSKDMAELHDLVARKLKQMVSNNKATAADLSVAIKFLKDNNVMADPDLNSAIDELKKAVDTKTLPFPVTKAN